MDQHTWPLNDERADLKDAYACCTTTTTTLRVAWYENDKPLSWKHLADKCTAVSKRMCTYSEVCPGGRGTTPFGGLQSADDAWCPVLEDDLVTQNYIHCGIHKAHFPCKKLTDSHAMDSNSWPLNDERADLKEAHSCCTGKPTTAVA